MFYDAIASWLHYLAFTVLFAALTAQHLLIKAPLSGSLGKRLVVLGWIAAGCALLMLGTGFWKWLGTSPRGEFLTKNGLFHAKVGLGVLVAVAVVPVLVSLQGLRQRTSEETPLTAPGWIQHVLRAQLALMLGVLLIAALVARGYGSG